MGSLVLLGKEWRMALKGSRLSVGLGTQNKWLHQSKRTSALERAQNPSPPTTNKIQHRGESQMIGGVGWLC